ncbi:MAG TPA: CDP-diacylglycerol--serine O-phosphatidyltransferase [Candidatus Latescibacteria bacterium]|nr:CDP-diacylglycerol--serine O-phosphatidyltransferase [Candidatus Latescibacterota bacterium]HQE61652.1 CDP-diacylglycerol--serine O-phosphatidyltransferase [Candidatus Latescibacterota bacterium]HQI76132.1 CDP-diacylglycerol--serine O-phosphatidyltransferase [Candidatus Latescibacterota bacterium]HQK22106.1 CDP-diacylglycerol--serine O-phosphatidyltransferase [Candidatus Latescibacterota bacterium]
MMPLVTQALPSVMTLGSLFCGLLAAIKAMEGTEEAFVTAAWLIIAAGLFDGLDGKVSRIFKTQSHFGVELDSIVDVCSFGFAPALLIYQFILLNASGFSGIAFPVAFVFLACGALRLARFNAQLKGFDKAAFKGVPIPAGAGMVASFVVFSRSEFIIDLGIDWVLPFLAFGMALLMVSTVRYDKTPRFSWHGPTSERVRLVVMIAFLVIAVWYPAEAFFSFGVYYVLYGLVRALGNAFVRHPAVAPGQPSLERVKEGSRR